MKMLGSVFFQTTTATTCDMLPTVEQRKQLKSHRLVICCELQEMLSHPCPTSLSQKLINNMLAHILLTVSTYFCLLKFGKPLFSCFLRRLPQPTGYYVVATKVHWDMFAEVCPQQKATYIATRASLWRHAAHCYTAVRGSLSFAKANNTNMSAASKKCCECSALEPQACAACATSCVSRSRNMM